MDESWTPACWKVFPLRTRVSCRIEWPSLCLHGSKKWQNNESIHCNKHAYALNLHTKFMVMIQDHVFESRIVDLIGRPGDQLTACVLFYVLFPTISYPSGELYPEIWM